MLSWSVADDRRALGRGQGHRCGRRQGGLPAPNQDPSAQSDDTDGKDDHDGVFDRFGGVQQVVDHRSVIIISPPTFPRMPEPI